MRITFVGPLVSTFVKNDVTILKQEHDVDAIDVVLGKGRAAILNLIRLHIKIILSLLSRDAVFFWFADYYTLVPSIVGRLLGKKVFVVAGGFDITYIPHLGIGARTRPARWFAVRNTFKVAHHIFPVSMDTQHDLDDAVPNHAPSTMIYNAVDTATYHYDARERQNIALTVSQADTNAEYKRKGIDLFIDVARDLPEVEFHVVGLRAEALASARTDAEGITNVTVRAGRVPLDDVLEEFWSAGVYCQLSIEERFGVSVAEAMSCGCIPVVAPVNALKEVVGNSGYVVERENRPGIVTAIRTALTAGEPSRKAVSDAAAKFDISERGKTLLAVVNSIGGHHDSIKTLHRL